MMDHPNDSEPRADKQGLRLRLASSSPRRSQLLPLLGYPVAVEAASIDERVERGEAPLETAMRLAEEKARAGRAPGRGEVVVGCDTVVVHDGRLLGKPGDASEALSMLLELRDRPHEVISGLALVTDAGSHTGAVQTRVQMRRYTLSEIEQYVEGGSPLDKAGAYAIQDRDFAPVERIDGCYLNVVGLPLCEVSRGLRSLGWPRADERYDPPCHWCEIAQTELRL